VNYLSHARLHLDQPHALVGTSLPDWLRVLGREYRLDPRRLPRDATGEEGAVWAGVRQHFEDDEWFHRHPSFHSLTGTITEEIRRTHPDPIGSPKPRHVRASFLAHVMLELLLDAWLAERIPDALDRYYDCLTRVDGEALLAWVAPQLDIHPTRLPDVFAGVQRHPFLRSYSDDSEVVDRLSQVASRVRLPPLPQSMVAVVGWARARVREGAPELLSDLD
jgi:hypothetical protein